MMKRVRLMLMLVLGMFTLGACATRATQEPAVQGADFSLEIHNPQPHPMNVRFAIGGGGALTVLGTVNAGETRRWSIPNRGQDDIRLVANDQAGQHTMEETVELEGGEVRRWEIR